MEKNQSSSALGLSVFGAIFFIFGFATTFIITLSAPVKGNLWSVGVGCATAFIGILHRLSDHVDSGR
jgi:hypothetical protein